MKLLSAHLFLIVCLLALGAGAAHAQTSTPAPYSGRLTVCLVLGAVSGSTTTIVDGSAIPGSSFTQRFINPNLDSGVTEDPPTFLLPSVVFDVPLDLNTRLAGIPNGPGASANNAECFTHYNAVIPPGQNQTSNHYYGQTQIQGSGWNPMRYHDGWRSSFLGLSSTDTFNNQMYDGNSSNNEESDRNGNADGHICLGRCGGNNNFDRTLVIYNYYNTSAIPTPAPTATPIPNFFNITNGNVFSGGNFTQSITNVLPPTERFIDNGILLTSENNQFGRDTSTVVDYYDEQYATDQNLDYDTLYTRYNNRVQSANLTTGNGNLTSGVYVHSDGANEDLIVGNGSPFRKLDPGHKVIVFVQGDLYIGPITTTNSIEVEADGNTFLAFIVKGNIGIHPNMRRIDGVYIAGNNNPAEAGISKGFVDTACDRSQGVFNGNECAPASVSTANTLDVNGFMYANGGYKLQRESSSGNPTEKFSLRPDFYLSGAELLSTGSLIWNEVSF